MSFRGKLLENSKEISSVALLSPACFSFFLSEALTFLTVGIVKKNSGTNKSNLVRLTIRTTVSNKILVGIVRNWIRNAFPCISF